MSENKSHFFVYFIVFIVLFILIMYFANKYNTLGFSDKMQEQKTKLLDSIDQRPRQLIIPNPPAGKEFCIVNDYTNVVGWDSISQCCVYKWFNTEHSLQVCQTAQINGEIKYALYDNNYIEPATYESYLQYVR